MRGLHAVQDPAQSCWGRFGESLYRNICQDILCESLSTALDTAQDTAFNNKHPRDPANLPKCECLNPPPRGCQSRQDLWNVWYLRLSRVTAEEGVTAVNSEPPEKGKGDMGT